MPGQRRPGGVDAVIARLAQPLLAWRRGHRRGRYVPEYERRYHLSREALAAAHRQDLEQLLVHAYKTVPYWREHMQAVGLRSRDLGDAEVLARLPILTRAVALENTSSLLSRSFDRAALVQMRTGGTTGPPLPLLYDRPSADRKGALAEVLRRKMGWFPAARAAYVWGAARDMPNPDRPRLQRLKEDFMLEQVERMLFLPANRITPEDFPRFLSQLRRFRPDVLQGYPTATEHFARWMIEQGETLEIPVVILTAEPIYPHQREVIARALSANVMTFYGSRENGWIASECPQEHRMHINTAGIHVEQAEDGRLLVTDLLNRGMPLIRYDIGDRGTLDTEPCPCGDPRPVLARLEGRVHDVFVLPSGARVPGVLLDVRGLHVDAGGVIDAKFVQSEAHTIDIDWVAGSEFDAGGLDRFREYCEYVFEGELELRLHQVERIEPEPNGKVRYCIYRVPPS